ncbi:hypothetical protein MRB53_014147 [Persea americana]|uniref:Uncharacterized protein n=1 Tax=Persea americana TaxID=3435 RepID=A0ACC2KAC9_PERAE|nr:hypothetical protein MRB53_014147 [Persea americana]
MAEGYLSEECSIFCSRYLHEVEAKFNRPVRNHDGGDVESHEKFSIFAGTGHALGKATLRTLSTDEWEQAHLYVLNNCDDIAPFVQTHKQMIKDAHGGHISVRDVDRIHIKEFSKWSELHVSQMQVDGEHVNEQIQVLAMPPHRSVRCFKGYIVNGFRFHTKDRERQRKTQNSGVFLTAETSSFASARDSNLMRSNVGYYGVLNDVMELQYIGGNRIVLFKCDWWDVMNRDFVSIQCCAPSDSIDPKTNISWISNINLSHINGRCLIFDCPVSNEISYKGDRIFDTVPKWCYNLTTINGQDYLIRGTFLNGLNVRNSFSADSTFAVTVVKDNGSPYISMLELRPLNDSAYLEGNSSVILKLVQRVDVGNTQQKIRYPDDDRIWNTDANPNNYSIQSNNTAINGTKNTFVPLEVIKTAATTMEQLNFSISLEASEKEYMILLYFLELNSSISWSSMVLHLIYCMSKSIFRA